MLTWPYNVSGASIDHSSSGRVSSGTYSQYIAVSINYPNTFWRFSQKSAYRQREYISIAVCIRILHQDLRLAEAGMVCWGAMMQARGGWKMACSAKRDICDALSANASQMSSRYNISRFSSVTRKHWFDHNFKSLWWYEVFQWHSEQ